MNYRHGMYGTRTYKSWSEMKKRCGTSFWKNISYCERWNVFVNFFHDMGERPENTTLDRIDNTKGYYKSNCRWADDLTQQNNKRSNVFYDYKGEKLTLTQIARKYNVSRSNLANKIYINKMTIDEAMKYLLGGV